MNSRLPGLTQKWMSARFTQVFVLLPATRQTILICPPEPFMLPGIGRQVDPARRSRQEAIPGRLVPAHIQLGQALQQTLLLGALTSQRPEGQAGLVHLSQSLGQ